MKKIKTTFIKAIYSPFLNRIIRPVSLLLYKISGKRLLSISGKLDLSVSDKKFSLLTNQTCSVTNALFYEKPINYEFTPIFVDLVKSSTVFYDIGANIGYFSIIAKRFNPKIEVVAFEPNKGVFRYLQKNIELNGLDVNCIEAAVSDQVGTLEFHSVVNPKYPWLKENLSGSHSLQNNYGIAKLEAYPVAVTTLSSVTKDLQFEIVDLLKLDTECTEHIILYESLDFIKHHKPIIICEVYHMIMEDIRAVIDQLDDYKSYQCFGNYLKEVELSSISDMDPERNFFFCPRLKEDRIKKFIR